MNVLTRVYLGLSALAFLAIGLNTLYDPLGAMSGVELHPASVSALNEVRANYGGLQIAFALLLVAGALRETFRRAALWISAAVCGGLLGGRLLGLLLDGMPNATILALAGIEAVSLTIASSLLWRQPGACRVV